MMKSKRIAFILLLCCFGVAHAKSIKVNMYRVAKKGHGQFVGVIYIKSTQYGLLFDPKLKGLKPGWHGFHVHQKPNCNDFGNAAGDHLDPKKTHKHLGPYKNNGHL